MPRILLAEDDDFLRAMTKKLLEVQGFDVFAYSDGQAALDAFTTVAPDLIISDINMPLLDGYGLLDKVRQLPKGQVVPFLFLSAHSNRDDVTQARELGADDFLFKPFEPTELFAAIEARLTRRRVSELFDTHQAHLQTITLLANVIEARDLYTRGHVERVKKYALELGRALAWSPEELVVLEYGALLHDIGKITVPETVLNKPGELTPGELVMMQDHPLAGAKIIRGLTHLEGALPYILYHHERWDGTGYPEGLKGESIPLEGRLLALADVYDALTSERPYHHKIGYADALGLISHNIDKQFDPSMAEIFVRLQQEKIPR